MRASPVRLLALGLALLAGTPARAAAADVPAGATVRICYNYGCARESDVAFDGGTLEAVRRRLAEAGDAAAERAALAVVVGRLYRVAAAQTPVGADREGNFMDQEVDGRMDCIDHSTSTTRLLQALEARGWLRFHRVAAPQRRQRFIFQHYSAVLEELAPAPPAAAAVVPDHVAPLLALCDCAAAADDARPAADGEPAAAGAGQRYVVDSWFVDNGEAAIVLPLAEWLKGEGPNVH